MKHSFLLLAASLSLLSCEASADEALAAKMRALFPMADVDHNSALSIEEQAQAVEFVKKTYGEQWARQIEEVTVDCWSTSLIINTGHRVRVMITSSNFPRFDVNPGTGKPWSDDGEKVKQTNRIYCDAEHPSRLLVPVVGGEAGKGE